MGSGYPKGGYSQTPVEHIALTKVTAVLSPGNAHGVRFEGLVHAVGYVKAWARGELINSPARAFKESRWGRDLMRDNERTCCGLDCGYQWHGPELEVNCPECQVLVAAWMLERV